MKKFLSFILGILFVANIAYAAQTDVETPADTFQTAWERQHAMNTELYGFEATGPLSGYLDGMSIERQTLSVVVSGTSVYLDVESTSAGDIDYYIDGTKYTLDCTTGSGVGGAARIEIAQGTAIAPKASLVYVVYSSQASALVLATTPLETAPTEDYSPVAIVTIQNYTSVSTNGALVLQRTTETVQHDGKGAISWEREKLRALGAQYWSGIDQALTITTNAGSEDNVQFDTSSGIVFQLHRQSLGDVDMSADGIFVANASGDGVLTNYQKLTDLNSIDEIADGTALVTGDSINLVIWGSVNYGGENKLFVNLPNAKYTNDNDAILDSNKTAITAIPAEFKTTGYLIAKIVLKYTTADSGTWANLLTTAVETWHTEAQTFNTPNWPADYGNNYGDYLATLTKAGAEKIRVVFAEFDTEENYDFIYLRDGVAATNIHTYHGNLGAFTSATIDGATMRVYFSSDGSVTRTGVRSIQFEYLTTAAAGQQVIDLRGIPTGFNLGASGGIASVSHNSLSGLQGGTTDEYYHVTASEKGNIANLSGTNTGDDPADDTAYNATSWNANPDSATKNVLRDKFESLGTGGDLLSTNNLSDVANAATSYGNIKQASSTATTGAIETATNAEVVTGTDTTRAVTPDGLTDKMAAPGAIGETTPNTGKFTSIEMAASADGGQFFYSLEDTDFGVNYAGWGMFGNMTHDTLYIYPLAVNTAGQSMRFAVPGNQTMSGGGTESVSIGTFFTALEDIANIIDSDHYTDRSIDSVHINSFTPSPIILAEPDLLQPIDDAWPLYQFLAESYPSGVTIDSIHISTSATCTDVLNFEEWSNNGTAWTTVSTVEAITLSGTHTEDDGTLADASIAADSWLYLDLPASPTDIAYYSITISFHAN